ncbi:DNA polymerase III subunit tau [Aquicella siphonis]|uniref:DNA polymerase III subunit gamma/tau n=1 Tax=Aquicella siphonis TaxID=254247 RepID=A0A5E4PIF9_9COXI|nr:DNA polymerase III subunit gamma/tau [Aquicella siphonis]VVC76172.1 DNA polymerase III subunit tau [Aquicella siphonis]
MSYQVLARKWRPRNFQDMVGQEPILRMLANALEQKRLHHAYLLTGTRGVGKTTLGRILSKCLNCESGITDSPCGTCHACRAIDAGQFLDLYEVDAASRTKVEDTRELLDNVLYPPTQGRYKIYLIDEVHMLSNHSFNALLKTLEEPPEHVKFILATTDPKRLPVTILSRCLQFHLKRITSEQIEKHLQHICAAENINHDDRALDRLARAADGSMRDALSLLDQAVAYGRGTVNLADIHSMLGCTAQEDLLPLLDALAAQNGSQVFELAAQLAERAPDYQQLLEELIQLFHKIAVIQVVPDAAQAEASLTAIARRFSPEDIQLYYQIALLGRRDLSLAPVPQQGFEMTLLRMLAFKPGRPENDNPAAPVVSKPDTAPVVTAPRPASASPADWRDILPKLELSGMAYALAANCTLEKISGNKVTLALSVNHEPMLNAKLKERITEALGRYLKQDIQLEIMITEGELITPLKQEQSEHEQKLTRAKQTILQDTQIKKLIDMYDATVEVSLI